LLLALSQTRRDFTGPRMRTDPRRLEAAALLYPPTDLRRLDRGERRGGGLRGSVIDFVGVAPDENPELWTQASPIDQIHPDGPPLLILQGTRDLLVPHHHTVDFAEQLIAAGGRCELHVVDEGLHGFERLAPDDEAKRLIARVREFLVERLR
jgi:acetyl esterase/lipase